MGTSIHVHSSTSPGYTRLSTLSSNSRHGHRKAITALLLSPSNPLQIISASEDGTVKIWDWVEGRLVRTIVMGESSKGRIRHLAVGNVGSKWYIFGVTSEPKDGKSWKGKDKNG
jgi:NET1-associated nuclear protein 1 (U3 small nucleolar RNA-associated protein 17)